MELMQVVSQTMESDIPLYMNANVSVGRKLNQLRVLGGVASSPVSDYLVDGMTFIESPKSPL